MSTNNQRRYMKVKPMFTHGLKKVSFCDAVKEEGIKFYKRTYLCLMYFLNKNRNKEKVEVHRDTK